MNMRIAMLTAGEAEQRAIALGFTPDWGRSNVCRVLLHQPAVAELLLLLLDRSSKLDRRLQALIIARTAWVAGVSFDWMLQSRELIGLDLSEADMLAVPAWRNYAQWTVSDSAALAAVDDVLATGRISDATWDLWNAGRPAVEATLEMVVAVGAWRMASELLRSLDVRMADDETRVGLSAKYPPPPRPQTLFDGSASAVDRLSPVDVSVAEKLCRDYKMNPGLAKSAVWSRMLLHPPIGAALSRQLYHLLQNGTLSARLREFIIMRIGWVTGTAYEWTRHWPHAMKAGITSDELLALRDWRNGPFNATEQAVLAATDETLGVGRVTDATWLACSAVLEPALLVEMQAVIGTWHLFSQMMRSLAIPLEADAAYWQPDGKGPFD